MNKMLKFLEKYPGNVSFFKLIMSIRLACGYYNDISKSKLVNLFARVYCILLWGYMAFQFKYFENLLFVDKLIFPIMFAEYTANMTISLYTKDKHLYNFQSDIIIIDRVMGWKSFDLLGTLVIIILTALKLLRRIMYPTRDIGNNYNLNLVRFLPWHFLLVYYITNSIVFELLWRRMQFIREEVVSQREKTGSEQDKYRVIKKITFIYQNLLMSVDGSLRTIKVTMGYGIVIKLFKTIVFIHEYIALAVQTDNQLLSHLRAMDSVASVILYCSLMFFAELVLNEVDKVKGELGYNIILCTDECLREVLYELIDYMQTRAPKYAILRIFPLNIKLFMGLASAIATYVIMMLQFHV